MRNATKRSPEEVLRWKSNQLSMLLEISRTLASTHEISALFQKIADSAARIMNLGSAAIYSLQESDKLHLEATFPPLPEGFPEHMKEACMSGHVQIAKVVASQMALIVPDTTSAQLTPNEREIITARGLRSLLFIPLCNQGRAIGVLIVGSIASVHRFTNDEMDVCAALANQAAVEIERTRLMQERQDYIKQIEAHIIRQEQVERSLYASEQRYRHLAENALDIIYRLRVQPNSIAHGGEPSYDDSKSQTNPFFRVEYISPSVHSITGYHPDEFMADFHFGIGKIHRDDLLQLRSYSQGSFTEQPLTTRVICKDESIIWLEHRIAPLYDEHGRLVALEGIARDVTDRKRAEEVQRQAYDELNHAYSATIESLSRSLELRDYETKGHSRRVVDLTMNLAKLMGVPGSEFVAMERGALLHDIGKMGIPDAILLKPGRLTDEEWEIMRRHPQLGYDILHPIEYLRPALTIPLYHHEKWDGTGYPHGLAGEDIPLPARIFSIVDVYDALVSDRPYRKAWSRKQAMEYIREQSGFHFDPSVVEAFARLIRQMDPDHFE